jgi:hypothetical protein
MNTRLSVSLWSTFAASLLLLAPVAAQAEERVCRGSLGAITVDNLRVPPYATCTLTRTRVKGTIKVEWQATVRASGVRVIGNVQADNHKFVLLQSDSRIGGSVQVKQGGGATVKDSIIIGDILYDSNSAYLRALRNQVGGNLQAFQNVGGVEIRNNVIDGNLQCKENYPRPVGGGNIVEGNKEDQCRRL